MPLIDTNLTYSQQVCDFAIGGYMGASAVLLILFKLLSFILAFYAISKLAQIILLKIYGKEDKWQKKSIKKIRK